MAFCVVLVWLLVVCWFTCFVCFGLLFGSSFLGWLVTVVVVSGWLVVLFCMLVLGFVLFMFRWIDLFTYCCALIVLTDAVVLRGLFCRLVLLFALLACLCFDLIILVCGV